MILCEKMVKERTEQLCEEYDQVLASKLAEQYEAFLKFNHDQVHRHFANSSEASCKFWSEVSVFSYCSLYKKLSLHAVLGLCCEL